MFTVARVARDAAIIQSCESVSHSRGQIADVATKNETPLHLLRYEKQ